MEQELIKIAVEIPPDMLRWIIIAASFIAVIVVGGLLNAIIGAVAISKAIDDHKEHIKK